VIRRSVPGQLSLLPLCLDGRDRAVLSFARAHHLQGSVASRVHDELGLTETRYDQLLLQLLPRRKPPTPNPSCSRSSALCSNAVGARGVSNDERVASLPVAVQSPTTGRPTTAATSSSEPSLSSRLPEWSIPGSRQPPRGQESALDCRR